MHGSANESGKPNVPHDWKVNEQELGRERNCIGRRSCLCLLLKCIDINYLKCLPPGVCKRTTWMMLKTMRNMRRALWNSSLLPWNETSSSVSMNVTVKWIVFIHPTWITMSELSVSACRRSHGAVQKRILRDLIWWYKRCMCVPTTGPLPPRCYTTLEKTFHMLYMH